MADLTNEQLIERFGPNIGAVEHVCGHSAKHDLGGYYAVAKANSQRIAAGPCPKCSARRAATPTVPSGTRAAAVTRMATDAQLGYLARLGVVVPADRRLTLAEASQAIDSAKRGGGVGWLGLFFEDGSN